MNQTTDKVSNDKFLSWMEWSPVQLLSGPSKGSQLTTVSITMFLINIHDETFGGVALEGRAVTVDDLATFSLELATLWATARLGFSIGSLKKKN